MIFTFLLTLPAGGQQRAGPPGGGRSGAAVSPSGWGGSRTAEKSGAVASPWCAVVPSVAHGGGRPSGLVRWLRYRGGGQCDPVPAGGLGRIQCGIGFRDERGAGDPVSWMGGGETDADRQHCLRADSAVFDGEGVQLCTDPVQCGGRLLKGLFGQQDEEFLSAVAS